jgi:redox-sensitive bicupin YhaK (pirin superfamily)
MMQVYPAESRFTADHGWLKSSHSFSFAEYYDPNNMNFGPLRVLNDDFVAPGKGFGAHPHRDMEIVSIVLRGQLQHEDSTGGLEVIRPGEIQRMTAGSGVVHSEYNSSDTEEVNFLQLWFMPEQRGLRPFPISFSC